MSATPQDVQYLIEQALTTELLLTTNNGGAAVTAYGVDPTKWPTTTSPGAHWRNGNVLLQKAAVEAGQLLPGGSATPQDVQSKIERGMGELLKTTKTGVQAVASYGADPTKWPMTPLPNAHWRDGNILLQQAAVEAGQLLVPTQPPAWHVSITGIDTAGQTLTAVIS